MKNQIRETQVNYAVRKLEYNKKIVTEIIVGYEGKIEVYKQEIEELRVENTQLKEEIAVIKRSFLWIITIPLRLMRKIYLRLKKTDPIAASE